MSTEPPHPVASASQTPSSDANGATKALSRRALLGWVFGGLLVVLCGLGLSLFLLAQSLGLAPTPDQVAQTVRKQTRTVLPPSPSTTGHTADAWCGAVQFFIETAQGEPVQGFAMLDGLFHDGEREFLPLDEEGAMTVSPVRCSPAYRLLVAQEGAIRTWHDVETTPGKDTYTVVLGPLSEEQQRRLRRRKRLAEICPLRVTFEHADGEPVSAPVRMAHVGERDVWVELDEAGTVDFPEARCEERPRVLMKRDGGKRPRIFTLSRVPDDTPDLIVTLGQTARVRVVDRHGERIEGVAPQSDSTVELLDSGDFLLTGYGDETSVRVGRLGKAQMVPLDGGLHEVEAMRDREVAVTLTCDQCVGELFCGPNPCEGTQPDLTCLCPEEDATLDMQTPDALWGVSVIRDELAAIPYGADAVAVRISGERGSIRFVVSEEPTVRRTTFGLFRTRADGSMPALPTSFSYDPYREYGLERDGSQRWAEELLPGGWTLGWMESTHTPEEGWTRTHASLDFDLGGGEDLDLGVIGR